MFSRQPGILSSRIPKLPPTLKTKLHLTQHSLPADTLFKQITVQFTLTKRLHEDIMI
ncbi:hypothetical protein [Neisseria sp. S1]|uniref:hypothetical protein n=1 Tax=Neisseria sp. S1 TaxID=3318354 RepID=UPI003A85DDAB